MRWIWVLVAMATAQGMDAQTSQSVTTPVTAASTLEGQPLSLKEAIALSLKNNLNVKIAKETRTSSQAALGVAEGAYDWMLNANFTYTRQKLPSGAVTPSPYTQTPGNLTLGALKPLDWGGRFELAYTPQYVHYDFSEGRPSEKYYTGGLMAKYTQSLLRGFGVEASGVNVITAKYANEIATYQYQMQMIDLISATEKLYWDLVFAYKSRENKLQSLDLAKKQLKENQVKVEVGMMAPIDVAQAEATVAQREQEIITAENALANAQDSLKRAIYPVGQQPTSIQPTDAPNLSPLMLDEKGAEKVALENRLEVRNAKLDHQIRRASAKATASGALPTLDASIAYNGVTDKRDSFGSMNGDLTAFRYPGYVVGLTFSMPLLNRTAKANLAKADAEFRSADLKLKDTELGIALDARKAYRDVESSGRSVKAAEKARQFSEKDLDAEQKKYANGMSTNFLVLSKQSLLDTAKATELQAQVNYTNALTALDKALGKLLETRGVTLE